MSIPSRVMLALPAALVAAIMTAGLIAALGLPLWQTDGVVVCIADQDQWKPQLVSDESGGALVVWEDDRNLGQYDVYAQRVDAGGTSLWPSDGLSLCLSGSEKRSPRIVSDGSGGAIVTWQDYRGSDPDIYVQRVDPDGNALWNSDGVSLCVATDDQYLPRIASDGAGGAIVTWKDERDESTTGADIYARRVNSSGNALWQTDGFGLCTANANQEAPQIVPDGFGGAIVTWYDQRGSDEDIYAQRVDPDGNTLWLTDGVTVCGTAGHQAFPQLATDGSGGAIITWADYRGSAADIYAQRVDANGNTLWNTDGVSLCAAAGGQYFPLITYDGAGGAIVAWIDHRNSLTTLVDIYAQRIDAAGNVQWQSDGVRLCGATDVQELPQIAPDGAGGAIVVWQDFRSISHYDVYAQRVDADGSALWQTDGVGVCMADGDQQYPQLAPDGSGGAIVAWMDKRHGLVGDIYAQRIGDLNMRVRLPLVARKYP